MPGAANATDLRGASAAQYQPGRKIIETELLSSTRDQVSSQGKIAEYPTGTANSRKREALIQLKHPQTDTLKLRIVRMI